MADLMTFKIIVHAEVATHATARKVKKELRQVIDDALQTASRGGDPIDEITNLTIKVRRGDDARWIDAAELDEAGVEFGPGRDDKGGQS